MTSLPSAPTPPTWFDLSEQDKALLHLLSHELPQPDVVLERDAFQRVDELLAAGANPNAVKPGGTSWKKPQTLLQVAVNLHHGPTARRLAEVLLAAGANPNPPEGTDQPPVVVATQGHDWKLVRTLVKYGARLDQTVYDQSLLLWALNDDNPRMVTWMARRGATLNEAEQPLLVKRPAALVGPEGMALLNALVKAGAQVDPALANAVPLVAVCEASSNPTAQPDQVVPVTQRLLALGARPNRPMDHTVTWSRSHSTYGGVDVPWTNQGVSALHWAAWHGNVDLVNVLLDAGADPLARTSHRASPSAMTAWRDLAKDLPTVPMPDGGASALDWARDAGHLPVVALLERVQLQHDFQALREALPAGPSAQPRL